MKKMTVKSVIVLIDSLVGIRIGVDSTVESNSPTLIRDQSARCLEISRCYRESLEMTTLVS